MAGIMVDMKILRAWLILLGWAPVPAPFVNASMSVDTGPCISYIVRMKTPLSGTTLSLYESRVKIIKAMAHPTRLFILNLLKEGPLCVCEINALIDADGSTISKHLLLLKNAGLVSSTKKGLQVHYQLEMPCVLSVFSCIEKSHQL